MLHATKNTYLVYKCYVVNWLLQEIIFDVVYKCYVFLNPAHEEKFDFEFFVWDLILLLCGAIMSVTHVYVTSGVMQGDDLFLLLQSSEFFLRNYL